jgi:hypothetical protein
MPTTAALPPVRNTDHHVRWFPSSRAAHERVAATRQPLTRFFCLTIVVDFLGPQSDRGGPFADSTTCADGLVCRRARLWHPYTGQTPCHIGAMPFLLIDRPRTQVVCRPARHGAPLGLPRPAERSRQLVSRPLEMD